MILVIYERYLSTIEVLRIDNLDNHAPFVLRFFHSISFEHIHAYVETIYEPIHRISHLLLSRNNQRFD